MLMVDMEGNKRARVVRWIASRTSTTNDGRQRLRHTLEKAEERGAFEKYVARVPPPTAGFICSNERTHRLRRKRVAKKHICIASTGHDSGEYNE